MGLRWGRRSRPASERLYRLEFPDKVPVKFEFQLNNEFVFAQSGSAMTNGSDVQILFPLAPNSSPEPSNDEDEDGNDDDDNSN